MEIRLDRSADGGHTFGSDITVQDLYFGDSLINGGISVFAYPAIDVDITGGPYDGYVYVAYLEFSPGYTDTDIYFTRSMNGGNNWSQKVRINDDPLNNGCDQFHPWLIVAPDGSIIVVFLDRRLDPNNLMMDCYMTTSTDGGITWSPNERITTVSCDPTAGTDLDTYLQTGSQSTFMRGRAGLLGEYIGVAASSIDDIHPIWTDTRFGHQDVFVGVPDTSGTYAQEHIVQKVGVPIITVTPNPAHGEVRIMIEHSPQMTGTDETALSVYDLAGRSIRQFVSPSDNSVRSSSFVWDGRDEFRRTVPAGVYFLRVETGDFDLLKKLLLIR